MYDVFVRFKALVENQFKHQIVTLYSDNGGEYQALDNFLSTNGISHLTIPPYTPKHNGISEWRHRYIVETGLSLLTHASMPLTFWTYAFAIVVYLINRMPTPSLHLSFPFDKLFESPLNFGCSVVYVNNGFVLIFNINLTLVSLLVFFLVTLQHKVLISVLICPPLKPVFLVMSNFLKTLFLLPLTNLI